MSNTDSSQRGVLTDIGQQKINAHIAAGTKLVISHFVIGDGNGLPVVPDKSGVSLIHQIGSEAITETTPDILSGGILMSSKMASKYNGQWIREAGLVDLDGDLIVWCSYSPTLVSLFTSRTMMINIPILSGNSVSITVDTNKKFATELDVINAIKKHEGADISHTATSISLKPGDSGLSSNVQAAMLELAARKSAGLNWRMEELNLFFSSLGVTSSIIFDLPNPGDIVAISIIGNPSSGSYKYGNKLYLWAQDADGGSLSGSIAVAVLNTEQVVLLPPNTAKLRIMNSHSSIDSVSVFGKRIFRG